MKSSVNIKIFIVLIAAGLAVFYAIAQQHKMAGNVPAEVKGTPAKTDVPEDSVESLGTPTNDDPWQEMKKLVDAYYIKGGVTYSGTMKLIDDNTEPEKIVEENNFEYTVFNDNYYYSIENIEVVHKKNYFVIVDHENKSIMVTEAKSGKRQKEFFNLRDFRKNMDERKAEAKVRQLDSLKILTIDHIEDPAIQGYRIYYDPITYRIQKMLIGVLRLSPLNDDQENGNVNEVIGNKTGDDNSDDQEKSTGEDEGTIKGYCYYLEINYKKAKILSLTESDFNPEEKFISISANGAEIKPAFSNYEFVSALLNKKRN